MFDEGTEISAFYGNRIVEGTIYLQNNGCRVLYNESTGKWIRLSKLSHIKVISEPLREDEQDVKEGDEANKIISEVIGNIDPEKIKTDSDKKQLGQAGAKILMQTPETKKGLEAMGIKDQEDVEQKVIDTAVGEVAKKEAQQSGGGDIQQAQQMIQKYQTLTESRKLREEFYDIPKSWDFDRLFGVPEEDDPNTFIYKLKQIKTKKDWANIGANFGTDARSAILRMQRFADESWISLDKKDDPLGVFGIKTETNIHNHPEVNAIMKHYDVDGEFVSEIVMLAFTENNRTFVRDVLNMVNKLKARFPCVCWSVDKDIPAYHIYEKWLPKNNGRKIYETKGEVYYIISKYFDQN